MPAITETGVKSLRRSNAGAFMIAAGTAVEEIDPTTSV